MKIKYHGESHTTSAKTISISLKKFSLRRSYSAAVYKRNHEKSFSNIVCSSHIIHLTTASIQKQQEESKNDDEPLLKKLDCKINKIDAKGIFSYSTFLGDKKEGQVVIGPATAAHAKHLLGRNKSS